MAGAETFPQSASPVRIEVAAGLVFRDGKLLITQRPEGSHLAGCWEFPGGKRELGESYEACLHRELDEELGIAVEIHECIHQVTHPYKDRVIHLQFYRCAWRAVEPEARECADFRWVTAAELGHFTFPPADTELLDRVRKTPVWWE